MLVLAFPTTAIVGVRGGVIVSHERPACSARTVNEREQRGRDRGVAPPLATGQTPTARPTHGDGKNVAARWYHTAEIEASAARNAQRKRGPAGMTPASNSGVVRPCELELSTTSLYAIVRSRSALCRSRHTGSRAQHAAREEVPDVDHHAAHSGAEGERPAGGQRPGPEGEVEEKPEESQGRCTRRRGDMRAESDAA